MKQNLSSLEDKFIKNFSRIYSKPSKINKYLKKCSNQIEHNISKNFKLFGLKDDFVIYANGGFGRQEMFPSSDVDISIIETNNVKDYRNIEKFITFLWDEGYKVGHSVRSINDVKKIAKKDIKEFTSYLTRKAIISNQSIDNKISKALTKLWSKKNFYKKKLTEQQNRYKQYNSTAFNLEPDLKESPGTLRDFHTALWILQHCYELKTINDIKNSNELNDIFLETVKSYNFVKSLRFATNIISNKNRLDFETQIEISKYAKLNQKTKKMSVEAMMKHFYENASVLSYFNEIVFEKFNEKKDVISLKKINGIYKDKNKIGIRNTNLNKKKQYIFEIFLQIGKTKKITSIDTKTKSLIKSKLGLIDCNFRKDPLYANQFKEILRSKYNLSSILKTMKNLGVLQAYIPEFSDVIGQMQFDLFHVYTVDEHTFKVVRNMRQMLLYKTKNLEFEHELINKINKIEILYIAGIFHDLGKGKGGNHSKIGAKMSLNFAKRLGMSSTDSNLISWLVEKHLIMSSISQKEDITDPETIDKFTQNVGQAERLDYLYLLTVNDIRATNPNLWNGWKHQLLKDLYIQARRKLNRDPLGASIEVAKNRKENILNKLKQQGASNLNHYLFQLNDNYFNKHDSESLEWQIDLILKSKNRDLVIGCKRKFDKIIEIFVKADNFKGLFLKLTQTLEKSGLEIIDASIFSSTDDSFAANTFMTKYSYHDRKLTKTDLKDLSKKIERNFNKKDEHENSFKTMKSDFKFEKNNIISSSINTEKGFNVITIETINRNGLLKDIAKVFFQNKVSISSARINTLGERVEDSFEICTYEKNLVSSRRINKIEKALKKIL